MPLNQTNMAEVAIVLNKTRNDTYMWMNVMKEAEVGYEKWTYKAASQSRTNDPN